MCPAHLTLPLLHSTLCASDWSSLTPTVAHFICSLSMSVSATCTVGKTNRTPNSLCMSFHVSTDQLERALHMFQACSFLSHVLSLCEPRQLEESSRVWPWAARLSEQGLLLELDRVRPTCLLLTETLLKFPQHSGMFKSLSMDVCRIVCICMLPCTVSTMHACCSSVVELLTSHGHLCLAHHTAIQVRVLRCVCVPSLIFAIKFYPVPNVPGHYNTLWLTALRPSREGIGCVSLTSPLYSVCTTGTVHEQSRPQLWAGSATGHSPTKCH